jgi:hypothetical protein
MNDRELATVLAALRYWQTDLEQYGTDDLIDAAGHFAEHTPLTPDEIDELCERLNAGKGPQP